MSAAATVTGRMTPRRHAPEGHKCRLTIWGVSADGRFRVKCEPCIDAGWPASWTFEGGKDIDKLPVLFAQHTGAVS